MANFSRCLAYISKLPPAISGSGGHDATLRAACECVRFGLADAEMWQALTWYNVNRCRPQWSEKELRHKIAEAKKKARHGERVQMQKSGYGKQTVKPVTAAELRALSAARKKKKGSAEIGAQSEPSTVGAQSEPSTVGAQGKPVSLRSEAEEEAWWARVFAERGITDPATVTPAEFRAAVDA